MRNSRFKRISKRLTLGGSPFSEECPFNIPTKKVPTHILCAHNTHNYYTTRTRAGRMIFVTGRYFTTQ